MRNDDNLIERDDETLRSILNEKQNDFSAEIVSEATVDDLDEKAINIIRNN
jgi:hypothetical protein